MIEQDYKSLKQFSELGSTIKNNLASFDKKHVGKLLYDDLAHLGKKFEFDLDMSELMQMFKDYVPSDDDKIQMGIS